MTRPSAAFLDRDGTVVRDTEYLASPEDVELLAGAAEAIARLNAAGVPVIVVTNQSGIGRGYLSEADYERVRARIDELLAAAEARIDASYHCPHHPDDGCECRKPGLALYRRAAEEHGIDPGAAVFIGDRLRDVQPAAAFGGRGIMLLAESTPADERHVEGIETSTSLLEAVGRVLRPARP